MTPEERSAQLKSYASAYEQLAAAVAQFPRAMWQFRPAPERWTIHEIIVHITDSEANSYVRCRRLLAEPGSAVLGYDESVWAQQLRYHDQSPEDALALFKWLRQASYGLVKDAPEAAWANRINHSENGWMTLDDWLTIYARHVSDHIAQMQGVYADWQNRP